MSKLSDVVKNDVVKKTVCNKLVSNVSNVDTCDFVLKTKYNTDKTELENKYPDTSGLVKKTNYNTKITEIEDKIPDISNLATKTALTGVENKIHTVNNLVKKQIITLKLQKLKINLIIIIMINMLILEFNKLATDVFNARLAQGNLITKTDVDAKLWSLNRKTTQNKYKHLLVENEWNKLKTFDSSYFIGKSHFGEDGTQNYLVLQPMYRYFKMITNIDYISSWKSNGLSAESFKPPTTSDNSFNPALNYYGTKTRVKFTGSCLKQSKISYNHGKVANIYIVYELGSSSSHTNDPAFKNCFFGAVTLTKNADIDMYGYSGYGIGFDRRVSFSFPGGRYGQNVLIFGVDVSFTTYILIIKKRHVSIRNWSNTRIRTCFNCRKNVFY